MGNYIKPLSAGVALIASDSTWIEGKAIQQLQTTAELDGMCRVVGLPDLHPGRGYPVGAAFFSVGRFYPALVGNDIGCGMALWETGLAPGKLSADKLEKRLGNLDLPLDETWSDCIEALDLPAREHWRALGTIGGGNHFAELQQVETVFDQAALHALGLDAGRLQLLVHSARAVSARRSCKSRSACMATPACSTAAWKLPPTWRATPMRCASPRVTASSSPGAFSNACAATAWNCSTSTTTWWRRHRSMASTAGCTARAPPRPTRACW